MRKVQETQMRLGEVDPRFVFIDPHDRDKLSQVLLGIQAICQNDELRRSLFAELESLIPEYEDGKSGRPGMSMWEIFVLATVRLGCNWDFDTLKNQAENHLQLRQFLGIGIFDEDSSFGLQTIRDCLSILTEETLMKLNTLIVNGCHALLGLDTCDLELRGDSFVVLSNVHYPTDINLLFDAMRKSLTLVARLADEAGLAGWRKWDYNLEKIRKLFLRTQRMKHSSAKDPVRRAQRERTVQECHSLYIDSCAAMFDRVEETLQIAEQSASISPLAACRIPIIRNFVQHGRNQIELIKRRVLAGDTIAHDEKVFSIFEEYTEWICKGKAGVKQELGLNVCILTDQYGFVLHHRVMEGEHDVDVAVPVVEAVLEDFSVGSVSFDKGFHSPANQRKLAELVGRVVIPMKGKPCAARAEEESSAEFVRLRRAHSAVESTINGLGHTGLDRCPDRGICGFRRYVALGIIARNVKTLGAAVRARQLEEAA